MIQYLVNFLHYFACTTFVSSSVSVLLSNFICSLTLLIYSGLDSWFYRSAFSSSFTQNGTERKRICLILWPGRLQAVLITTGDSTAFQPLPANDSGHDVMLTSQNDSIETEQALVQLVAHPLKPCHWQHGDKEGLSLKSPRHVFLDLCEWFTNLYQWCVYVPLRRAHLLKTVCSETIAYQWFWAHI